MTQSELLGPLVEAIETVQGRIDAIGGEYSSRETFTRLSLIDPILNALGWDVSNPHLVRPEVTVNNLRPDYVLYRNDGKTVVATVEAKALNVDVLSEEGQMLQQVLQADVRHAVLTNGDRWLVYDVTKPTMAERRIVDVQLRKETAAQAALRLLALWHPNIAFGQPVQAQEPLVGPLGQNNGDPPVPPAPTSSGDWIPLSEFVPEKGKRPSSIRFPDSAVSKKIGTWRSIVVEVVEWLYANGSIKVSGAPFQYSRNGRIDVSPFNAAGKRFTSPYKIGGQDLYVEMHGNAQTTIDRSKKILNHFQFDAADIHLTTSDS